MVLCQLVGSQTEGSQIEGPQLAFLGDEPTQLELPLLVLWVVDHALRSMSLVESTVKWNWMWKNRSTQNASEVVVVVVVVCATVSTLLVCIRATLLHWCLRTGPRTQLEWFEDHQCGVGEQTLAWFEV